MDWMISLLTVSCVLISQSLTGGAICPTIEVQNGVVALNSAGVATVFCNIGFGLVGNLELLCLPSGQWNDSLPSCVRDCGQPKISAEIYWSTPNGTSEGSSLKFFCKEGFALSPNQTLTCEGNGSWVGNIPICLPDCKTPEKLENGDVSTKNGTLSGALALYTCKDGYVIGGGHVIRHCKENGQWDGSLPTCKSYDVSTITCPSDTDWRGNVWPELPAGQTSVGFCPEEFIGNISRECGLDGEWKRPRYSCVRSSVKHVQRQASTLTNQSKEADFLAVTEDLSEVASAFTLNDPAITLTDAEIDILSSALMSVVSKLPDGPSDMDSLTNNVLEAGSSLIDQKNRESWQTLEQLDNVGADQVLDAIETVAFKEATQFSVDKKSFIKENIALEVKKTRKAMVTYPDSLAFPTAWRQSDKTKISMRSSELLGKEWVSFGVLYKNMTSIISAKGNYPQPDTERIVNGPVVSLTVISPPSNFSPEVTYIIEHSVEGYVDPSCNFWVVNSDTRGHWSSEGCNVVTSNETITECQCDHLTNFAVLMSPFVPADADSEILRFITFVGVGVSLLCLLVTFMVHVCLLRYINSDRVTLLLNLCVALSTAYIVFLGGIDKTESKVLCTVIAAFLHYILLVAFFIMMAEGVDVTVSVLYVFERRKQTTLLVILAWVLPAVIVGVSLFITKTDGYGNNKFCWLVIDKGLIWAFVGPAIFVIFINILIIITVIYKVLKVHSVKQKTNLGQIKTSIWSICVLVPLMGISWIFGIFYIDEGLFWVQYVFAICNGLQGFFIFLVHCVLNVQVRKAFKKAKDKRKRSAAMTNANKFTARKSSSAPKYVHSSSLPMDQSVEKTLEDNDITV